MFKLLYLNGTLLTLNSNLIFNLFRDNLIARKNVQKYKFKTKKKNTFFY